MDFIEQLESLVSEIRAIESTTACAVPILQLHDWGFRLSRLIQAAKSQSLPLSQPEEQKVGTWNDDGTWNCDCAHDNHGINGHTNEYCDDCGYSRPDLGNGEKPACAEQEVEAQRLIEDSGEPLLLEMPGTNTSRVGERLYGLGSVVSYIQKLPSNYGEFAYSAMVNGSPCPITQAEYERLHAKITEAAHSEATPSLVASAHREDSLATK